MAGKHFLIQQHIYRLTLVLLTALLVACNKIDDETLVKIEYWDKQADIMTLLGPQKEEVFAWVFAIDPHARYSGERLTAKLETLAIQETSQAVRCISLTIDFDERDRVKAHKVWLNKRCESPENIAE